MAILEQERKRALTDALTKLRFGWVAIGISIPEENKASALDGITGLVDWAVHGQVSRLLLLKRLSTNECCLLPGDVALGRPSFLFFPVDAPSGPQKFAEKIFKLGIKEIVIAESTFPGDFLAKLKQTLKKEGVSSTKLEPES